MPIYEYECLECSKTFEEVQKISDPEIAQCRFCKGEVRKLLSAPGIIFKGSGWYVTDYANADRKKAMASDKKETPACSSTCKNPC